MKKLFSTAASPASPAIDPWGYDVGSTIDPDGGPVRHCASVDPLGFDRGCGIDPGG